MRINQISSLFPARNIVSVKNNYHHNPMVSNNSKDIFVKSESADVVKNNQISFQGYDVYIIDGGSHADDMKHFIKALNEDVDVHMYRAENTTDFEHNKPLKNIEEQLKYINKYGLTDENSFVAVPVKIDVPLQNLAEQYKRITGDFMYLKPHTIQSNKTKIMNFLKVLYENPEEYRKYINYMDPNSQGIEYAYGIIQEINKLKCKKVYVPVVKPQEKNIEWLARERGELPELTNYLATGYDKDGKVSNMMNILHNKGWYDFNLLALSNADVVNMKKIDDSDHLYSAYDTTIKDGARGVYNLTPIRQNGEIIGYSYSDMITNQYPYHEFPYNDSIKTVSKFVGLSTDEVVADDWQTEQFKQALRENRDTSEFSNKLYPVWKVFNDNELRENKIFEKGDFVDSTLNYYFRRNGDYKIIYPQADVEASGRPSVMGMRDGDFALFTAISRDVDNRRFLDALKDQKVDLNSGVQARLSSAISSYDRGDFWACEDCLGPAKEYVDILGGLDRHNSTYMKVYKYLADSKYHNGDLLGSNGLYNLYLNNICKNYLEERAKGGKSENSNLRNEIIEVFGKLGKIAERRGENIPATECKKASREIQSGSKAGELLIRRRANDDVNIGDLLA